MKILIYGRNPKIDSGMGKVGHEIAVGLSEEHDVHFFAPTEAVMGPVEHGPYKLYGDPTSAGPGGQNVISAHLNNIQPDLLVTNRNWQSLLGLASPLNAEYMQNNNQVDVLYYGPPIETEVSPPGFEEKLFTDHLNNVYCVPFTKNRYDAMEDSWGLGDYLVDWVPHGVDHDVFRKLPSDDVASFREQLGNDGRFTMIQVAENWRRKNIDLTLEAFSRFKELSSADPVLILHASPTPTRGNDPFYSGWNLDDVIAAYGLETGDEVHITKESAADYVDRDVLAMMYNASDIMVLPTGGEAFSLTTLEAMACGTPALQTDVETLRWLSQDSADYIRGLQPKMLRWGERMVTPSVDDMVEKMIDFYLDKQKIESMSEAALERSKDFSWDRTRAGLLGVIDAVRSGRRRMPRFDNLVVFMMDALRRDYFPRAISEGGVSVNTIAQGPNTPQNFTAMLCGEGPDAHGVTFFQTSRTDESKFAYKQRQTCRFPTVLDLNQDGYDTAYYDHPDDPMYNILNNPPRRRLGSLSEPFVYVERETATHVIYGRNWRLDDVTIKQSKDGRMYEDMDGSEYIRKMASEDVDFYSDYEDGVRIARERFFELVGKLEDMGVSDNTLIVATADHGECFGEFEGCPKGWIHNKICPHVIDVKTTFYDSDVDVEEPLLSKDIPSVWMPDWDEVREGLEPGGKDGHVARPGLGDEPAGRLRQLGYVE